MADIKDEIESLRDYMAELGFTRIWTQHLPERYSADELIIRYAGDSSENESGYHFRIDRDYQFVYFADNELDIIQRCTEIQRKIENGSKLRINDSENFITLGSFSFSQPFKAENGEVFAVIGILQAQVREARTFEQAPKMQEINVDFVDE